MTTPSTPVLVLLAGKLSAAWIKQITLEALERRGFAAQANAVRALSTDTYRTADAMQTALSAYVTFRRSA